VAFGMSQRESGYARKERDLYETPAWVTEALLPHLPRPPSHVLEPASGAGKMAEVLRAAGLSVTASDLADGHDFLAMTETLADAIITNPPYTEATAFIEHALDLTKGAGMVAMLLRTDFDHARTRQHLFAQCGAFAKKVVLTRRIIWFDGPKAAPSFNHAWYLWDWQHSGAPTLAYDRQMLKQGRTR